MSLPITSMTRKIERWLWLVFFLCTIVFMVSWSLAQVMLWGYNRYSKDIELWIETESGYDLSFAQTYNQMSGVNPLLAFKDLKVVHQESGKPLAHAKNIIIELNTLKSIWYFRPVLNEVVVDGLEMTIRQQSDLSWSLDGLVVSGSPVSNDASLEINRWIDLLFYQGNIDIRGALLHLYHADEPFDRAMELDLVLSKQGDYSRIEGEVQGSRNPIDMTFRGEAIELPGDPDFNFDLFIEVEDLDSLDWTDRITLSETYQIDRLATTVRTWINWSYRGVDFVSQSELGDITVRNKEDGRHFKLSSKEILVAGNFSDNHCSINIPQAQVELNGVLKSSDAHRVICDYQGNWWWTTPEVHLETLVDAVSWLPSELETLKKDISVLSPKGTLNHPVAWLNSEGEFRLEAQVEGLSADPWEGAPGATNIHGKLVLEQDRGFINIEAGSTALSFPEVFQRPQHFDRVSGRVDWWYDENVVRAYSDGLKLDSPSIDASVGFAFELEMPADEARLGVDVQVTRGDAGQILEYLPIDLDPSLLTWLQASLPETAVKHGRLLFTTTIDPIVPVKDTLLIDAQAFGKSLEFDPSWPEVENFSGHFALTNQELTAQVHDAVALGNPIQNLNVYFPEIWKEDAYSLDIGVESKSRLERFYRFIENSPLNDTLGAVMGEWEVEGDAKLHTKLTFDLEREEVTAIDVEVNPLAARVVLPDLPEVSQVTGSIYYNDQSLLSVKDLKGKALKGPVELELNTEQDRYVIKGRGTAEVPELLSWQKAPKNFEDYLSGNIKYFFDVALFEQGEVTVDVRSDLQGVVSLLPHPMAKPDPESSVIFVYQGKLSEAETEHAIDVGALNVDLNTALKDGIDRTTISFGQLPKDSRVPDQGTFLFARLAKLDIKSWLEVFADIEVENNKAASGELSVYADLAIEQAQLGSEQLDDLSLSVSSSPSAHRVAVRSRQVAGIVRAPKSDTEAIQVELDYLRLGGEKKLKKEAKKPLTKDELQSRLVYNIDDDPLAGLDPSVIPAMNITIRQLRVAGQDLGVWRGNFQPIKKGTLLTVKDSNTLGFAANGQLWWTFIDGRHTSYLDGNLKAGDVSEVSKKLGYDPTIRSKSAQLDTFLYWDGSPASFNRLRTQGLVDLAMNDGAFLNVSESANTLKLFGLFNLSSLSRRLKLDFSDVYSTGLAFDEVSGQLSLNKEVLVTDSPVTIRGPSSQMLISGTTNLAKETLDYQLRLTVPVSGTLPIAVVVAGVAPIVGGLLLLGQQVWGGVVDQFVGVDYQVSGTWDEPILEAQSKVNTQQN